MIDCRIIITEDDPADERVREEHDPFLPLHEAFQMRFAFLILSPDEDDLFHTTRLSLPDGYAEPGLLLENADELPVGFSLVGLCGEADDHLILTRDGELARARFDAERDTPILEESFAEAFPAVHTGQGMWRFVFIGVCLSRRLCLLLSLIFFLFLLSYHAFWEGMEKVQENE